MAVSSPNHRKRVVLFFLATALVFLALLLFYHFLPNLSAFLDARMKGRPGEDSLIKIPKLILWSILAFLGVRALNSIIFDFIFRIRRGYEAPTHADRIHSSVRCGLQIPLPRSKSRRAFHHLGNLWRRHRSGTARHSGKLFLRDFAPRRSAVSSRRRDRGGPTKAHGRRRRDHLARNQDSHISESYRAGQQQQRGEGSNRSLSA